MVKNNPSCITSCDQTQIGQTPIVGRGICTYNCIFNSGGPCEEFIKTAGLDLATDGNEILSFISSIFDIFKCVNQPAC